VLLTVASFKEDKTIQLHDLGTKDYKETWEYEELFKGIVDLKFEIAEKILNYQLKLFSLWSIHVYL
jgi:lipoyl(octanoyl) transferase